MSQDSYRSFGRITTFFVSNYKLKVERESSVLTIKTDPEFNCEVESLINNMFFRATGKFQVEDLVFAIGKLGGIYSIEAVTKNGDGCSYYPSRK